MDMFPPPLVKSHRVLELLRQREIQSSVNRKVFEKLHVTENLISRLGLEKELVGHKGCVNCLEWNETGQVLASASDDMAIILWDPFKYEKKLVRQTGHRGNIFSVKFMPESNDRVLVSGAADYKVHVHDISATEPIFICRCHTSRVKRIATAATIPSMFWTAGEDGVILQYDIRGPHNCQSNDCRNVLINLTNHMGSYAEAKCIAINPKRPELIAIGANDAYIRMYDRRMIKLSLWVAPSGDIADLNGKGDPEDNVPLESAQYFSAGHLPNHMNRYITSTYLTFSDDGNELLVNISGEQVYLFDINNPIKKKTFFGRPSQRDSSELLDRQESLQNCLDRIDIDNMEDQTSKNVKTLPPEVEELKLQANKSFENHRFVAAINLYNKAISLCPTASVLFSNRAAAYMMRAWEGDIYAALRDCQVTLLLDPENVKAHFRLARCLFNLARLAEAEKVIDVFLRKFPQHATSPVFKDMNIHVRKMVKFVENSRSGRGPPTARISAREAEWRRNTIDYKLRFCGHSNTTTDIKEANFFGTSGQYIIAGSDDGSIFIWDRNTTNILRVLLADERILNCLQSHPYTCLLATSGIDPVVRLWSPLPEDGRKNSREVKDVDRIVLENQIRTSSDPLEVMLMNVSGSRSPRSRDS